MRSRFGSGSGRQQGCCSAASVQSLPRSQAGERVAENRNAILARFMPRVLMMIGRHDCPEAGHPRRQQQGGQQK